MDQLCGREATVGHAGEDDVDVALRERDGAVRRREGRVRAAGQELQLGGTWAVGTVVSVL